MMGELRGIEATSRRLMMGELHSVNGRNSHGGVRMCEGPLKSLLLGL
jgi:hypothetical protein